ERRDRGVGGGAEDRLPGVADDAVLDDGLDLVLGRHGVEVRAEEDRLALGGRLERGVEVAHRRADAASGVVLVRLEPAVAEVALHAVGNGALLSRRTRDRGELEEEIQHLRHGRAWYARERRRMHGWNSRRRAGKR